MQGFTLIELVIVVLVLGILAGLAQPMLSKSVTDARLRAAASEVATALEYARATAINSGRACRVEFDVNAETVVVSQVVHDAIDELNDSGEDELDEWDVDDSGIWSYSTMDNPLHPGTPYVIDFDAKPVFGGVDIVSALFGASNVLVDFDALGAASEDGLIVIGFGGRTANISVDDASGRVTTSL